MPESAYPMLPVSDALAIVLREAAALRLPARRFEVAHALGLVLAAEVRAVDPLPPFAASIKDGYAVVAADGAGEFPIVGRVTAGHVADFALAPGQVAYITTGAPMPPGADAVVQVEESEPPVLRDGRAYVRLRRGAQPGEDVRPVGFDVAAGAVVLAAGERLGPAEVGLAATVGVSHVQAVPRPRVGVLSTGDELLGAGEPLRPGAIHDSNRPALLAAVQAAGAEAVDLGIARDDEAALRTALARGLAGCDLLVTTGGVSMGELDLVKQIVEQTGQVHFGRLLMKPGKPCTFATIPADTHRADAGTAEPRTAEPRTATRLLFGLPGNPVSSLVTFYLLALPAIRALAGRREPTLPRVQALLSEPLRLDPARPEYHRAHLAWDATLHGGAGGYRALSSGNQASSRLLSMRGANALLELPQAAGTLPAGSVVPALLIG